ncbi:MAG: hypothetical protein IT332_10235 [Ardenticatenales bacterium]|nr:hypothetical protein [Ardenticatenales bacterium]
MSTDYALRDPSDYVHEQKYLTARMHEIEAGLGRVAAETGTPTPITERLDTLDRARELVSDMYKQVQIRSLEAAVAAQMTWLDGVDARQSRTDGEPKNVMTRVVVDRALLNDILAGWRASQAR